MKRVLAAVVILAGLAGASTANAQERNRVEGPAVVTIIPGGGTYFTKAKDNASGPSFGNYDLGGAIAGNFSKYIGVEAEVSGKLGVSQSLGPIGSDTTTPNMLNYTGNIVISAANHSSVVPYATAGVGGLSVFEKAELGINETETFFTSNVGGGVKWYSGRWGLRGDYRFIAVESKDDAPVFFGHERRYGHRFYGAVLVNLGR
jgi:Outer membrane protein beta-barrel domain